MASKNSLKKEYFSVIRQCGPIGVRHLQAMLLAFLVGINEMVRTSINIGIVLATDSSNNRTIVFDHKNFDWTPAQRGIVFSSFLWFYPFTNFIGAYFCEEFDNKSVLLGMVSISSMLTLLTPLLVYWGELNMLTMTRLLQGAFQGLVLPNIYGQMSRWFPPNERGRLIVIVESANALNFGLALSLLMGGVLAIVNRGWEYSYYIMGLIEFLWCVLWSLLGAHDPNSCTYLSEEERSYINNSLANNFEVERKKWISSLKEVLVNKFSCALIISHVSFNWGNWTLQTVFPTFLRLAHGYPILQASIITAMPQLLYKIFLYIMAYVADVLINKNITTTSTSRNIFNTIGLWGTAACLLCLAFADGTLLISMYTITVVVNSSCFLGFFLSHLDIAPSCAGAFMGLSNGIASFVAAFAPMFVGITVQDLCSQEQWAVVYCFTAYIYFMGNLVFIMTSETKM